MASTWTTTLPQGTTKIRMLPNICQDRWQNIQQGEVPSTKWQLAQRAGNPGTILASGLIFTKDAGAGITELFYKDDAGNTAELTNTGGVGALTQKVYANNVTMKPGATEINNPQQAFCCAFAFFTGQAVNGTYAPGAGSYNITNYIRTGTGKYTVTLAFTATSALTYVPNVTVRKLASPSVWTWNIVGQTATKFDIFIYNTGTLADADFCVSIFGAFT